MSVRGYVRLALPSEAVAIAEIQRAAWSDPGHPGNAMADALDVEQVSQVWYRAITRPPLASYRVLVSVVPSEHGIGPVEQVVGFVVVAPSDDLDSTPDAGSVNELALSPGADEGHRTRLIQAAVDTMRADGFRTARWWVPTTDDPLRAELDASGWAPDGAHTELQHPENAAVKIRLVRLHTDISA